MAANSSSCFFNLNFTFSMICFILSFVVFFSKMSFAFSSRNCTIVASLSLALLSLALLSLTLLSLTLLSPLVPVPVPVSLGAPLTPLTPVEVEVEVDASHFFNNSSFSSNNTLFSS